MPASCALATLVEERMLERNKQCESFFREKLPGWPRSAAKCRSASYVEAAFSPSAEVPTLPTRSMFPSNSCIP